MGKRATTAILSSLKELKVRAGKLKQVECLQQVSVDITTFNDLEKFLRAMQWNVQITVAAVAANIRPMTTVAGCDFGSHRRLCSFESAGRKPDEGSMLIKLASIVEVHLSCHGCHRSDVTGMYIQ